MSEIWKAIESALGSGARMARFFNHPIRPMLIPLPIGLWITLSVVGVLLLGVAEWLGGELVFRHGVAVEREPSRIS